MIKKRKYLIIIFIIFSLITFSSAKVSSSLLSSKKNYTVGDPLNITFSLNFTNLETDWFLETSEGHKVSLRDLLKLNGVYFSCEYFNCKSRFVNFSNKLSSITINPQQKNFFGLFVKDYFFSFDNISFRFSISFEESNELPLRLIIANLSVWEYSSQTENYSSFFSYGCFDQKKNFSYNKLITNQRYCEKISNIPQTKKVLVGVNISNPNNQSTVLKLSILNKYRSEIGNCTFDSYQKNTCLINFSDFINGEHYVCISSINEKTDILLGFQENQNSCGLFVSSPTNGDYSIFLKIPTYSSFSGEIFLKKENLSSNLENKIRSYLLTYYRNNCSMGCFIPFVFEGKVENLMIREVKSTYSSPFSGITLEEGFYVVSEITPKENFSGVLDLSKANFFLNSSGQKNISFYLTRNNELIPLFSERINIFPQIFLYSLNPRTLPSKIKTNLILDYYAPSQHNPLFFIWSFKDDNISKLTYLPSVDYLFNSTGEKTVEVTVITKERNFSRTFFLDVVSPKNLTKYIIKEKKQIINQIKDNLSLILPQNFYQDVLSKINLVDIENVLLLLEDESSKIKTDEEILNFFDSVQSIHVPSKITILTNEQPLFISPKEISSDLIVNLTEKVILDDMKYKDYLSSWSIKNIDPSSKKISKKIDIYNEKNELLISFLFIIFDINVMEDSNFYIYGIAPSVSSHSLKKTELASYLPIQKNVKQNISFLFYSEKEPFFYMFPNNLNNLTFFSSNPCNINKICEKNRGEDYKNCREDCKPWGIAILLIIVILVFLLIFYFIVISKLKEKYEKYLFKSKKDLLNIISFFKSYEEKGLSSRKAIEKLVMAGWTKEQAVYASKKAKGEKTRPYEIIPIDKIKMLFNKK